MNVTGVDWTGPEWTGVDKKSIKYLLTSFIKFNGYHETPDFNAD